MRIAIDARLNAYRQGGIPQYTRQLITALADIAAEDQIVSFQHRDQLRPLAIAPNVLRRTALTPPHHRFEQWTLPLEVLLSRPDVLHCPDFIAPVRRPCPAVVTIHDLAFMHYPEILDDSARAYYGQVSGNAPRADAIIAVSESTRQDIAQFLDIPIEQIDVIYEAAAPLYTRLDLREGEARVLNSTPVAAGTFMLFVSTLEPRKNLPTLLQALRICIDRRPEADYQLVIVGRRGWRDDEIFQTARDLKLADHVLFTGGVGQYDLRWLYNACRLYINPSLYEGFGLPLLEAMACGAPSLAAATSSLPEIGGDAAIYVPPLEAEQWADEIMALWDDQDRRAELGRMGMARAQQFSWHRAARETLKVYRRAADRIVPRAEPLPAPRYSQPPEPLPAIGPNAPRPDALRPCLRCGTALLPGDLQAGVSMRASHSERASPHVAPRVWSCPRCGYVELVDETYLVHYHEDAAAEGEQLDSASAQPVKPEANGVADEGLPGVLLDDPAVREDATVADVEAPDALELADDAPMADLVLPDEPGVQDDTPAADVAAADALEITEDASSAGLPSLEEPILSEDALVTDVAAPDGLEAAEDASSAGLTSLDEPTVFEDAPVADAPSSAEPVTLEDAPGADAEPTEDELWEEPVALEAGSALWPSASSTTADVATTPAYEQAALSAVATLDTAAQEHSVDNGSEQVFPSVDVPTMPAINAPAIDTDSAHVAHSPKSPNGAVLKSKSNRRSRSQSPAAESAVKQPAKRRSSSSKRKQTT